MASSGTTVALAVAVLLGFAWIGFFEPSLRTTEELAIDEHRLVLLRAADVQKLRVRRDEWTAATVERVDAHSFRVTEPGDRALPPGAVERLLSQVEFARVEDRITAPDAQTLVSLGLDRPVLTLTLGLADGQTIDLAFGKAVVMQGAAWVRVGDTVDLTDSKLREAAERLLDAATAVEDAAPGGDAEASAGEAGEAAGDGETDR
jgi:hypothetical protein